MQKKISLFVFLLCTLLSIQLLAANSAAIKITATVPVIQSIEVTDIEIPASITEIAPTGDFSDDINDTCWNVVPPIKIQLSVTNNTATRKLVLFTNHRDTTRPGHYWPDRLASLPQTATINGLINITYYTETTWYATTAPLRAFLDIYQEGTPTSNNEKWAWIQDVSSITTIAQESNIGVLYEGDIRKSNLDVYLKTCWDSAKEGGDYQGKLIFGIISQ